MLSLFRAGPRAHVLGGSDEPTEEGSGQPVRVRGQTNTLSAGWFPALFAANMAVWRDGYFRVRRRISLLLLLRGSTATCWRKGEALNKLTERAHPERLRRRHQKNEKIRKKKSYPIHPNIKEVHFKRQMKCIQKTMISYWNLFMNISPTMIKETYVHKVEPESL